MGEAANWNLELAAAVRACRGRWTRPMSWAGWGRESILRRVSGMSKDPKRRERAGLGAHGSKPQRETWAVEIWSSHIVSSSDLGRECNQQGRMCGVRRGSWWNSRVTEGADDETPPKKKKISKRWRRKNSKLGTENFRMKKWQCQDHPRGRINSLLNRSSLCLLGASVSLIPSLGFFVVL